MTISATSTVPSFRSFAPADIETLEALQACPRPAGWRFHLDHDDDFSLISIQPPRLRHRRAHDPLYITPAVLIAPAKAGGTGVMMTAPGGSIEAAFASLADALRHVGPPLVSWKRWLGLAVAAA